MNATFRFTQIPMFLACLASGMDIIGQGRNISTLHPPGTLVLWPSQGPSHCSLMLLSGATLPSSTDPPRFTMNQ